MQTMEFSDDMKLNLLANIEELKKSEAHEFYGQITLEKKEQNDLQDAFEKGDRRRSVVDGWN